MADTKNGVVHLRLYKSLSMKRIAAFLLSILVMSCNSNDADNNVDAVAPENAPAPLINYSVVNSYPHDTASFTEGLLVHEGQLYESTGSPDTPSNNGSWFGKIDLKTGKASGKIKLPKEYFGEGICLLKGKIYQLTWQNRKGFVYDANTLKKINEFNYNGEGWALTTDSTYLIMSDGSSNLRYLDPDTLRVMKILGVQDNNGPVANLNELEFIKGFIYANIWMTNYIVKIEPSSGRVVAKLDFTSLVKEAENKNPKAAEMNGIAYDAVADKIYVTGKCWPTIYEVRF
jgi:glutaminyl-peptide cyclotransferase